MRLLFPNLLSNRFALGHTYLVCLFPFAPQLPIFLPPCGLLNYLFLVAPMPYLRAFLLLIGEMQFGCRSQPLLSYNQHNPFFAIEGLYSFYPILIVFFAFQLSEDYSFHYRCIFSYLLLLKSYYALLNMSPLFQQHKKFHHTLTVLYHIQWLRLFFFFFNE